jgi:hypothetical protein
MPSPEILRDGASSIVLDERWSPLVFLTWFGEPTEPLVRSYFEWNAGMLTRAKERNRRLVTINDAFATDRPSPKVRQLLVDLAKEQPPWARQMTLQGFVVVESALIRGAVTALSWLDPNLMSGSKVVPSIEAAIEAALAVLDEAGIPRPAGASAAAYRRPERR